MASLAHHPVDMSTADGEGPASPVDAALTCDAPRDAALTCDALRNAALTCGALRHGAPGVAR